MRPEARDDEEIEVVSRRLEHLESLAVTLEHRVLDGVVDHLDEVTGARRPHVRIAIGRRVHD